MYICIYTDIHTHTLAQNGLCPILGIFRVMKPQPGGSASSGVVAKEDVSVVVPKVLRPSIPNSLVLRPQPAENWRYPLVICYSVLWTIAIEIVCFPIKNGDVP